MPTLIMKRVVLLGLALFALGASSAEAATVRLHADHHVRSWRSEAIYGAKTFIEDEVIVQGHSLTTTTVAGCRVTWAGKGIAVQANSCGRGPIRLRYVSFGEPRTFKFVFRSIKSSAEKNL